MSIPVLSSSSVGVYPSTLMTGILCMAFMAEFVTTFSLEYRS